MVLRAARAVTGEQLPGIQSTLNQAVETLESIDQERLEALDELLRESQQFLREIAETTKHLYEQNLGQYAGQIVNPAVSGNQENTGSTSNQDPYLRDQAQSIQDQQRARIERINEHADLLRQWARENPTATAQDRENQTLESLQNWRNDRLIAEANASLQSEIKGSSSFVSALGDGALALARTPAQAFNNMSSMFRGGLTVDNGFRTAGDSIKLAENVLDAVPDEALGMLDATNPGLGTALLLAKKKIPVLGALVAGGRALWGTFNASGDAWNSVANTGNRFGQGMRFGIGRRIEAFTDSFSWRGGRMAGEIQQALDDAGFALRDDRREVREQVLSGYLDYGLSTDTSLALMNQRLRSTSGEIGDFTRTLEHLAEIARATGFSTEQMARELFLYERILGRTGNVNVGAGGNGVTQATSKALQAIFQEMKYQIPEEFRELFRDGERSVLGDFWVARQRSPWTAIANFANGEHAINDWALRDMQGEIAYLESLPSPTREQQERIIELQNQIAFTPFEGLMNQINIVTAGLGLNPALPNGRFTESQHVMFDYLLNHHNMNQVQALHQYRMLRAFDLSTAEGRAALGQRREITEQALNDMIEELSPYGGPHDWGERIRGFANRKYGYTWFDGYGNTVDILGMNAEELREFMSSGYAQLVGADGERHNLLDYLADPANSFDHRWGFENDNEVILRILIPHEFDDIAEVVTSSGRVNILRQDAGESGYSSNSIPADQRIMQDLTNHY